MRGIFAGTMYHVCSSYYNGSHLCTQSAAEDIEVVHLREENAKLKKERESMVRRGM